MRLRATIVQRKMEWRKNLPRKTRKLGDSAAFPW
jgi:hypothetical protein